MHIEKGVPMTFSVSDAADIIGVSRSQVYVLLKTNELESTKIRNSRRLTEGQLTRYLNKLENQAKSPGSLVADNKSQGLNQSSYSSGSPSGNSNLSNAQYGRP